MRFLSSFVFLFVSVSLLLFSSKPINASHHFGIYWKAHPDRLVAVNSGNTNQVFQIVQEGTNAFMWYPNGALFSSQDIPGPAQRFEWLNGDQLRWFGTDKCLAVKDGNNVNGNNIQLTKCSAPNNNNQKWEKNVEPNGEYQLKWKGTDKCIEVLNGQYQPNLREDGTIVHGTPLVISVCDRKKSNQQFILQYDRPAFPPTSPIPTPRFFGIYWKEHLDRVLTYNNYPADPWTDFWPPNGLNGGLGTLQLFEWINNEQISLDATDLCLDVDGNFNNAFVFLRLCDINKPNQKFIRRANNEQIEWKGTGKCLEMANAQLYPSYGGQVLEVWECDPNNVNINQQFILQL